MNFRESLIAAVLPQAMDWVMRQSDAELCAIGLAKDGDIRPQVVGRLAVMVADAAVEEARLRDKNRKCLKCLGDMPDGADLSTPCPTCGWVRLDRAEVSQ